MTAPTQYNGKPIIPGTWMARCAEAVGEQADKMTALEALVAEREQAIENARASQQMHEDARWLLDQTLTERDALQKQLADALKRIAEMELNESLREEGERWAGL